jgi:glucose/mannose-6-phosphate isomerase
MMNLDDPSAFADLDPSNMLAEIDNLPDQLASAWELGEAHPLPAWEGIQNVLITGMGGSAIGADLLVAYVAEHCPVPVVLNRNYSLPAWARGPETLVIASSHSGNTEETLAAFEQAQNSDCKRLAIATRGKLAHAAQESSTPLWTFEHQGQPRAAVGYSFGLLLSVLARLGLIPDPSEALAGAIAAMRTQQTSLGVEVPVADNPAKRLAGQLFGRWVVVMGADILEPVARRWKGQVNELAKAWGQFEVLPEANHNTLAGVVNPEEALSHTMIIFLRAPSYHPRNQLRTRLTKEIFMLEGLGTDYVDAQGDTPLAHLWTALHFGDYVAYYLAIAYGMDPTPITALVSLKSQLSAYPAG